jgi:hypothetical protein
VVKALAKGTELAEFLTTTTDRLGIVLLSAEQEDPSWMFLIAGMSDWFGKRIRGIVF